MSAQTKHVDARIAAATTAPASDAPAAPPPAARGNYRTKAALWRRALALLGEAARPEEPTLFSDGLRVEMTCGSFILAGEAIEIVLDPSAPIFEGSLVLWEELGRARIGRAERTPRGWEIARHSEPEAYCPWESTVRLDEESLNELVLGTVCALVDKQAERGPNHRVNRQGVLFGLVDGARWMSDPAPDETLFAGVRRPELMVDLSAPWRDPR